MANDFSGTTYTLVSNGSVTGSPQWWPGGAGEFTAEATWGGGTVKLQTQTQNGTWIDVGPDVILTANGGGGFYLPPSMIRASVATATVVYAYARQM